MKIDSTPRPRGRRRPCPRSPCPRALRAQGQPIRIGSTLALTGPLSATAQIHKLVGEIYVEQLNKRGGLLGRQVEWVLQGRPVEARPGAHAVRAARSPPTRSTC